MSLHRPARIAITTGEPAGIGPDVSLAAAIEWTQSHPDRAQLILVGDGAFLAQRARDLGLASVLVAFDAHGRTPAGALSVQSIALGTSVTSGFLDPMNAPYILATLDWAIDAALRSEVDAVVTAPVQKSVINDAHIPFTGHTEYFAARTGTPRVVMMLAGGGMRVALATTHLPLAAVPSTLTRELLREVLEILYAELRHRFYLDDPRILVCGLNPHAGEGGYLGREEIDVISPVIEMLRREGRNIDGPLPADTLFQPKYLEKCDAVLAMFHDQGLPVLKHASFGLGVNITLGLPIIRTSVDHGTALDLAGTGRADAGSMVAAIDAAFAMIGT